MAGLKKLQSPSAICCDLSCHHLWLWKPSVLFSVSPQKPYFCLFYSTPARISHSPCFIVSPAPSVNSVTGSSARPCPAKEEPQKVLPETPKWGWGEVGVGGCSIGGGAQIPNSQERDTCFLFPFKLAIIKINWMRCILQTKLPCRPRLLVLCSYWC